MIRNKISNTVIVIIVVAILAVTGIIIKDRLDDNVGFIVSNVAEEKMMLSLNNSSVIKIDSNDDISNLQWVSDNLNVVTLESNNNECYIKGNGLGTSKVRLIYFDKNGKAKEKVYQVSVVSGEKKVEKLEVKEGSVVLTLGDNYRLFPVISPIDAVVENISYQIENNNIAYVDEEGIIYARNTGTTTLTISNGQYEKTIDVYVIAHQIKPQIAIVPEKIIINDNNTVFVGNNEKISYSVSPANANLDIINWENDNVDVLKVNNGSINGLREGVSLVKASFANLQAVSSIVVKANGSGNSNAYGTFAFITLTMDILPQPLPPVSKTLFDSQALADSNHFLNLDEYFMVDYSAQLNSGETIKYCIYDTTKQMTCAPTMIYNLNPMTPQQVLMTEDSYANHVSALRIAVVDSNNTIISATETLMYFYYENPAIKNNNNGYNNGSNSGYSGNSGNNTGNSGKNTGNSGKNTGNSGTVNNNGGNDNGNNNASGSGECEWKVVRTESGKGTDCFEDKSKCTGRNCCVYKKIKDSVECLYRPKDVCYESTYYSRDSDCVDASDCAPGYQRDSKGKCSFICQDDEYYSTRINKCNYCPVASDGFVYKLTKNECVGNSGECCKKVATMKDCYQAVGSTCRLTTINGSVCDEKSLYFDMQSKCESYVRNKVNTDSNTGSSDSSCNTGYVKQNGSCVFQCIKDEQYYSTWNNKCYNCPIVDGVVYKVKGQKCVGNVLDCCEKNVSAGSIKECYYFNNNKCIKKQINSSTCDNNLGYYDNETECNKLISSSDTNSSDGNTGTANLTCHEYQKNENGKCVFMCKDDEYYSSPDKACKICTEGSLLKNKQCVGSIVKCCKKNSSDGNTGTLLT